MAETKEREKQLDLELKYSRLEPLYKIKRFSKEIEKTFTVLPFWRNGLIWAAICAIAASCVLLMFMNTRFYYKLPSSIPFIFDTQKDVWLSIPKILVWVVPFVLGLVGIINLQILSKVYYMNKNMTLMICALLVIMCFLTVLSVNEIFIISTL